jgi:Fur family transcriptional regulator, ferric uptake regulator
MCQQCDYKAMLALSDLDATGNRLSVLEVIGNNACPLSANDIFTVLQRGSSINKVTVYRILDLLVEHQLVERLNSIGRLSYYGLGPNENHPRHPHFYCSVCGRVDCLGPESLNVDYSSLQKTFPGKIDKIEIRVDGVCKNCLS